MIPLKPMLKYAARTAPAIAVAAGLSAAALGVTATPAAAAAIEFKKLSYRFLDDSRPVLDVHLIEGRWQLRNQDRIHFRLRINVSSKKSRINQATIRFGSYQRVVYRGRLRWLLRMDWRASYKKEQLGNLRQAGPNICGQEARDPNNAHYYKAFKFSIFVGIIDNGGRSKVRELQIPGHLRCNRIVPRRSGPLPQAFKVKGVRVRLTKYGQQCPLKVFAQVRIRTNKPGKVRYVLRSSRGGRWTRQMLIQFKNNRGVYEGRFDHSFQVKKSSTDRFWVEIKGRRNTRPKFLKVVCKKQGPKGMTK